MKTYIIPFLFFATLLLGCTDREIVYQDEHIIEVIDDNDPPLYSGVTTVELHNYINKIYIDIMGREPLEPELLYAENLLRDNNFSENAIKQLLNVLMNTDDYYDRFNDIYLGSMLNSTDSTAIANKLELLNTQLEFSTDILEQLYFQNAIDRLEELLDAKPGYQNEVIDLGEYISRILNNVIYDEINMGTENFVLSCFENLFKRLPTESELQSGKNMVDGQPAQLLLTDGATKDRFIEIMTTNAEFYQGISIDIYRQLLARDPSSPEMGIATTELNQGIIDYKGLQKQVIKTEEYTGF
jgi:hypothetical protein